MHGIDMTDDSELISRVRDYIQKQGRYVTYPSTKLTNGSLKSILLESLSKVFTKAELEKQKNPEYLKYLELKEKFEPSVF